MTSGQFASITNNYGKVGYFRNLQLQKKSDGNWYYTNPANTIVAAGDNVTGHNHFLADITGDPSWRTTIFFGGPGAGGSCDPF